MIKTIFLIFWLLTSCATNSSSQLGSIPVKKDIFLPINYGPVEQIRLNLVQKLGFDLKKRDEAHITVITPPEFEILQNKISMAQINELALKENLQSSNFIPLCVGRGRLQIDGREESTYYIVTSSPDLMLIREKIQAAYVTAGGKVSDFQAEIFFPHITLGFTKRDLHFNDGVIKDTTSCVADVAVTD
jgi:hypothetical protein